MNECQRQYPPIEDYALISDCHSTALISRAGSIDWCCMPRMDSDSCFGRLLDWKLGGFCSISPAAEEFDSTRSYLPGTLILLTEFKSGKGHVKLYDFFSLTDPDNEPVEHHLIRIAECVEGTMELDIGISPRFDFGEIAPFVQSHSKDLFTAWASNQGLVIYCDQPLELEDNRDLMARVKLRKDQKVHLSLRFEYPEKLMRTLSDKLDQPRNLEQELEDCSRWWKQWSGRIPETYRQDTHTVQSALVLKGLTFERTGAIAAAATTSLPEWIGGNRNWDYRYTWVRDSVFAVRALHELGFHREAERFGEFIERSSAGSADELQIMFGIDGKRRLTETQLDWLEGYRQSRPVRIGNEAARQLQLDTYAELMELAWLRHTRGEQADDRYWNFLREVVQAVVAKWDDPDHGIWEMRNGPRHFVHSKALCWSAINRGVDLATECGYDAPIERWNEVKQAIRESIERHGYDRQRGVFTQAYDGQDMDGALLLLPHYNFIDYNDPRMIRTAEAIMEELDEGGLLLRYKADDGLEGCEGTFLPCTFWLVCCLAQQGKVELAQEYYQRATSCANDLGLLAEEYDVQRRCQLGNFPQVLTHVSQITAKLSLQAVQGGQIREREMAEAENEG